MCAEHRREATHGVSGSFRSGLQARSSIFRMRMPAVTFQSSIPRCSGRAIVRTFPATVYETTCPVLRNFVRSFFGRKPWSGSLVTICGNARRRSSLMYPATFSPGQQHSCCSRIQNRPMRSRENVRHRTVFSGGAVRSAKPAASGLIAKNCCGCRGSLSARRAL